MSRIINHIGDDTNASGRMQVTRPLGLKLRLRYMLEVEVRNGQKT